MPLATSLFWRHVGRCPDITWSLAHVLFPQRQAEIRNERLLAFVQQDVARFDVAMDKASFMGVVQRLRDRRDEFDGLSLRQAGPVESRREVTSVDVLGDDEA